MQESKCGNSKDQYGVPSMGDHPAITMVSGVSYASEVALKHLAV
jgi:hypothetical protein